MRSPVLACLGALGQAGHEKAKGERACLVNELANVFDHRDWRDSSFTHRRGTPKTCFRCKLSKLNAAPNSPAVEDSANNASMREVQTHMHSSPLRNED